MSISEAFVEGEPTRTPAVALDIDRSKLRPPSVGHEAAGHERLLRMRPDRSAYPVVAVVAPAGYGKSTLLAEWVEHGQDDVLWVTLDTHDDDPLRLVNHVAAALLETGVAASVLEEGLHTPAESVWSRLMPRLSATMQSAPPFTLVFDDAHEVSSPESWDVIDWLVLHVPPGAQLAIAGRTAGGSVMPRLQLEGKLLTLGTAELALRDGEAHALLRAAGAGRSLADAARLNRACGGWAAGLLLSAAPAELDGSVDVGPGTQAELLTRYVEAEVLERLAPGDQEFLRLTSFLRLASAPLCDAVLRRSDSHEVLERLCASSAFTSRLGHGWCRTHELVRSALLRRQEAHDPEQVATLRDRAASWHAEHGSPAEAFRYAVESGSSARVAELIGRYANMLFGSGQWALVSRWFEWAESEGLAIDDQSVVTAAVLGSALTGQPDRSLRWAAMSQRSRTGEATIDEGLRALVDAWLCRRGADAALADAERAVTLIPASSPWLKSAQTALGVAQLFHDLDSDGEATFRQVVEEPGPAWVDVAARTASLTFLAILMLRRQQPAEAEELLERANVIRREAGITEQGVQSLVDAVSARVTLATGSGVDEARRLLTHAHQLRGLLSWAMPAVALIARLELTRGDLAVGDIGAARVVTREIADILRRRPGLGTLELAARELGERVAQQAETLQGPSSLTAAELRLMPWLATHLSFREIGERLFLSTNTVKTEALSSYRKLGASSRSEAVKAAVRVGVLDPASLPGILSARDWTDPPPAEITPSG